MKSFKFNLLLPFGLVAMSNAMTIEGPKSVSDISQSFSESASFIVIVCGDGRTYEYMYPDPDNEENNLDGARSVLSQLYYANENGLQVRFFHEGDDGSKLKISGVDTYSP